MQAKLKATFRSRALALFSQGKASEEVVNFLQNRYHADRNQEEIRRAYFVRKGAYSLSCLEGKPREDILGKMASINRAKQRSRKTMSRLHEDKNFEEMRRQSASRTLKALWQDPDFVERSKERSRQQVEMLNSDPAYSQFRDNRRAKARETMVRLRSNPEFLRVRAEGVQRMFEDPLFLAKHIAGVTARLLELRKDPVFREKEARARREYWANPENVREHSELMKAQRKDPEFELLRRIAVRARSDEHWIEKGKLVTTKTGFEGDKRVPIVLIEPIEAIWLADVRKDVVGALEGLSSIQRQLILEEFGFVPKRPMNLLKLLTDDDRTRILVSALAVLRKNGALDQYYEDVANA
jgi:hypothetical protein